jgi:hypothetical protein
MNLRFVLFMAFCWLGFTAIGNITDGYNYVTATNVQDMETMSHYEVAKAPSNIVEQAVSYITNKVSDVGNGWAWLSKITTFDYSMFKDANQPIDPVTGQYPDNDWVILRYVLMILGFVCVVDIILIMFGRAPA